MSLSSTLALALLCTPALASSGTTTVGSEQNGKTVQIKPETTLTIVLGGASGSTGYSWNLTEKPRQDVLRVVTDGKVEKAGKCPPKLVGCPENTVFVFRAGSVGNATTRLELVLLPPGRQAKPAKTYTLEVHVA